MQPVCVVINASLASVQIVHMIGCSAWTDHWNHGEGILKFQTTRTLDISNVSTAMFITQALTRPHKGGDHGKTTFMT